MTLADAVRYCTEESHIMPCCSVTCGTADEAVFAQDGVVDLLGTPVTEDTLYDLASVTKLFTAFLAMRLVEEGKLDVRRPVTAYAPQFVHLNEVPVEDVLTFQVALQTPERIDTQKNPQDALRQLFDVRPGKVEGRAYSDIHAMVAKFVVEGAAQAAYSDLLSRLILSPLGMAHTYAVVPENQRVHCASYDREHRLERGTYILRQGVAPGMPHDPKARALWPMPCGHAGLFSTRGDLVRLCQGILRGQVVNRQTLRSMARNRTGFRRPDGSFQQYLGTLCYVKHPIQYSSEIPAYESDQAIGLAGFTGHHLSVDVETGVFVLMLGNRVLDRLTVLIPESGKTREDYGLNADGTGRFICPDGSWVWSSVDYVHHKDAHVHQAVADTLGLPRWRKAGTAWS